VWLGDVSEVGTCHSRVHTTSLSFTYTDPKRFAFTQLSEELPNYPVKDLGHLRTVGSIEVRNAVEATGSDIQVELEIRSSDARLTMDVGVEKDGSNLRVKTPKGMREGILSDTADYTPCLNISAVIWIPLKTKLENLDINSEKLDVVFHPGLDYAESRVVETKTKFDLRSTYSRETTIDVDSASVIGSYPLYDLLSVHSNSGSIHIRIDPKNASTANVKPAVLRVTSNSGSIVASCSTAAVPDRDYQTTMSISSGAIDAVILHGLRTSLRSISGQITANLYPYGHNDSRTDIEVHETSGSIDIALHSSLSHPTAPLKKLYAYYGGSSGSLTLFYPAQWQGTVEGTTSSGSIDLDWQGLKVVKDRKERWVKRTIEAIRGEGEGKLVFYETSGSVKLGGESGGL